MTEYLRTGDAGYDTARTVWNAMIDRRPAVIARCTSTAEVAEAVRFGRTAGLEIAVRCGGHNIAGLAVPDGGLMIDLTPMSEVRVDPALRRAWVQGGALLGELDKAAQEYGLATTAGNVSHTGVGGLTLGGGMGWLARRFGLSCDNVISYEVVTADGAVVRASADENAELFWGLRGGGGNFGIVTSFEFQLHEIGTRALIVELSYPMSAGFDVLRGWRELNVTAPREATFTANITGDSLTVGYVWVGEGGEELLPAFRALGPVTGEMVEETTYLTLQTRDDNVQGHRFRRYWKGHYFKTLPDEAIRALLDNPGVGASLQAYGGAIADVPDDAAAFSHRDTQFEFVTATRWEDPAEDATRIATLRGYAAALAPYANGAYVNTLNDDPIQRAFPPAKLERLVALKTAYDPANVFHLNQNIRPAGLRDETGAA
ncbi:FAD-binding oxidoreductase [Kribbella shirazensis]|uniref:FAD/FMN-containing dehydrogenase n=1 Tax=Kribbella shirazensis TaxID=1105143 RepID=A0A7X5V5R3_9ACTN|nr:FAD-binding oxidoreductase [Kribbella shirazensis]NIK54676.1 FAD/FMN-containing dehydrogenase [Kribbella shirazensis]